MRPESLHGLVALAFVWGLWPVYDKARLDTSLTIQKQKSIVCMCALPFGHFAVSMLFMQSAHVRRGVWVSGHRLSSTIVCFCVCSTTEAIHCNTLYFCVCSTADPLPFHLFTLPPLQLPSSLHIQQTQNVHSSFSKKTIKRQM